jgi:transposase
VLPPKDDQKETPSKSKKRVGKREDDLSSLPVEKVDYELSTEERECPQCGAVMSDIGVDVRRELKLIPARVVVVEHTSHVYACEKCQRQNEIETAAGKEEPTKTPIIKAPSPTALISGSLASPSLVAHIAVQKYSNGMPLYRIEKGFTIDGINISRQTMSNWVIKCSEMYFIAIYLRLIAFLLKETTLHADETTVQVLHEPDREAQTKSYEWVYRTGRFAKYPIVIYDYKETRNQSHPQTFLKEYKGLLHTDGYQVYHNLPPDIVIVGCWAHLRRKWENIYKTIPKAKRKETYAERGLLYVNALFDLEREFKNLTPEERYKKRLEKSKPISDEYFTWVGSLEAVPKSQLGEPKTYSISQRKYLENVFLDGRAELSNNRCEQSVKPFVMGRKAWLFSNTPNGATASSVMYSIIETAKMNGLHPFHYIKFLLEVLPKTNTADIDDVLPWSDKLPVECRTPMKAGVSKW